ncbi:MAG: hypothetical protein ACPL7M_01210 [Bryobacteraceae bacterium]
MFEHVLVADWSARSRPAPARPSRDALWWHATWLEGPRYCRTPEEAESGILDALRKAPAVVLAGFDFCFALPAWAMHRLGGWRALWRFLAGYAGRPQAETAMRLNRLLGGGADGPFWGFAAQPSKPRPYLWTEFRACELRLKGAGLQPKPVFQLCGAGAVGAQTLAGVPVLERLRSKLRARVWPFEPVEGAQVVLAEVWPALLGRPPAGEPIPDRWQVRTLAAALRGWTPPETPAIAAVEGWIAGPSAGWAHQGSATLNLKS